MTTNTLSAGRDTHGNEMSGDRETIERYDLAIDQFLRFAPDVVESMTALVTADSPAPMGVALAAYLHLMSTDADDLVAVSELLATMTRASLNDREAMHARAIGAWSAGRWSDAARILDELLIRWPTDLLALLIGHELDFFVGDAASLRDRPLRTLAAMDPEHPRIGYVRGMTSFGFEECGDYPRALEAGLAAVDVHPDDVWAVHAVAHTYEMQGRVSDGIRFMTAENTTWKSDNLFTVHLWWHLGLYQLEAGRVDDVLAIYDDHVHHPASDGVPVEMLDASAMLWRLHLDGVDTGRRFSDLADAWAPKVAGAPWYVFNDLHAVMAFIGADRLDVARAVIRRLEDWLPTASGTNRAMTSEIGLPACRAFLAHAEGRHADVVSELAPIRRRLHQFGGSHAQRDVVQRTLLDAAIRDGQLDLAGALIAERLAVRETSVFSLTQRARVLRAAGDLAGAEAAARSAETHRGAFAAEARHADALALS